MLCEHLMFCTSAIGVCVCCLTSCLVLTLSSLVLPTPSNIVVFLLKSIDFLYKWATVGSDVETRGGGQEGDRFSFSLFFKFYSLLIYPTSRFLLYLSAIFKKTMHFWAPRASKNIGFSLNCLRKQGFSLRSKSLFSPTVQRKCLILHPRSARGSIVFF